MRKSASSSRLGVWIPPSRPSRPLKRKKRKGAGGSILHICRGTIALPPVSSQFSGWFGKFGEVDIPLSETSPIVIGVGRGSRTKKPRRKKDGETQ